jgi:hypothetical protein
MVNMTCLIDRTTQASSWQVRFFIIIVSNRLSAIQKLNSIPINLLPQLEQNS